MQLSKRLLAVADLASAGHCLADVGTDHGYIPIYLIEEGRYEKAIAMDIKEGPLLRAQENRSLHGLQRQVELRLSDGVKNLKEGEADTVIIAGMGGGLVIKILMDGAKVLKGVKTLVLQPQSELARVREFLFQNAYRLEEEHMVLDEGKYYPMMCVRHGTMEAMDRVERKYGPLLIKEKNPVLKDYLGREEKKFLEIRERLQAQEREKVKSRLKEVEEELRDIQIAKERMA